MPWPILVSALADFTAGPPNLPGANVVALEPGTQLRKFDTNRGRQYELAVTESGTLDLDLLDPSELLSPQNSGSAWNTGGNSLLPYRGVQLGAWLNPAATVVGNQLVGALSGNVLNGSNWAPGQPWIGATYGYDPSFENWSIQTTPPTGGSSLVSGLPSTALNANTGFETAITPWVVTGGTVVQSGTQHHSGSFAAKVTPSGSASVVQLSSELVAVVPGRQYTVTAWVWVTTAVTTNFVIGAAFFDAASAALVFTNATLTSIPATTWTQVTATFTAPPSAAFIQVTNQLAGTPPSSNVFYLDDCSVTNLTAPTDGTAPVSVASFTSTSDNLRWTPRFVPSVSYTFTVDVWAATGLVVKVGWAGVTSTSTTITGNNAYQTVTLAFTTAAGDAAAPISYLYVETPSAGSFPQSVYVANYTVAGINPGWTLGGSATMAYRQTQAQAGSYSMACTTSNSTDSLSLIMPTVPGRTYTFSAYLYIQNTGTGLTATQTIGANTVTLSTAATWTREIQTFTATAATTTVTWKSTTSAYPAKFFIDSIQLELASSASAFTTSGPVFNPIFTGWIERYPQTWDFAGRRGTRPLTGVDALSPLSRITPNNSYSTVILADGPVVYMPLNDSAAPQAVQLPLGGQPAIGYTSLGNSSSTVNFAGDTFPDGTRAVSVVQQNANPVTSGNPAYITYLGTRNGNITMNPQAFTIEAWVKVTSGTPYLGMAAIQVGETPNTEAAGPNYFLGWSTGAGQLRLWFKDPNGSGNALFGIGNGGTYNGYPDGNWHYLALILSGGNIRSVVDNFVGGNPSISGTLSGSIGLNNLFVDSTTYFGDPVTQIAVANMAAYPVALSAARLQAHYQRGVGYFGETDMARCQRLLNQYWSDAVIIGTPQSTMSADFYYYTNQVGTISTSASTPPSLLQDLQDITSTSLGFLWCDTYGLVHVDSRETRYTAPQSAASQFTFSDNPTDIAGGALPYEDLEYDYDPTYVYSQAQLTCDATSNVTTITNATAATNYGQRILSQTAYFADDWQTLQAANFYTQRYATPPGAPGSAVPFRISTMTINPAANPALWQAALSLDVDDRITVTKKTSVGVTVTGDYYIEQVAHSVDAEASTWTVTYQMSPVFNKNVFIAGHPVYGAVGAYPVAY